jgi:HAD superfamily hydrolase (TIGR01509 family)
MGFPGLVIFDCDGVLVDSELLACGAIADSLAGIGMAFPLHDVVARYLGVTAAAMFRDIEARTGRTLPAGFAKAAQDRILAAFRRDLRPMPGVEAVLDGLPCAVCVASGSTPERIRLSLSVTSLLPYFGDLQFSATLVPNGKPAPDLFLFAARHMSAAPKETVVVEDSPAGVQAACAAGMGAVGFIGGSHCRPDTARRLLDAGAHATVARMADLPAAIGQAWSASQPP